MNRPKPWQIVGLALLAVAAFAMAFIALTTVPGAPITIKLDGWN